VLSPRIFSTLAPVTTEPAGRVMVPGFAMTLEKKSSAVAFAMYTGIRSPSTLHVRRVSAEVMAYMFPIAVHRLFR
jgi:hypothetical protein